MGIFVYFKGFIWLLHAREISIPEGIPRWRAAWPAPAHPLGASRGQQRSCGQEGGGREHFARCLGASSDCSEAQAPDLAWCSSENSSASVSFLVLLPNNHLQHDRSLKDRPHVWD